jgi:hypothetical protein
LEILLRREAGKARRGAWSTGGIWLKPAAVPTNGLRNGQPVELAALSCFCETHEMNDSGTDPRLGGDNRPARAQDHIDREASPTAAIIDSQSVKSAEKVGPALTQWLRCGQENQRQEASSPGRHARPVAARDRSCCRYAGSRWRCSADERTVRDVSLRRLPGRPVPTQGLKRVLPSGQRRDRQAIRYREQVCRLAQAMDRGTDNCLAQPLPQIGQRLGMPEPQRVNYPALGLHPGDGQKARSENGMISDRPLVPAGAG